MTPTTTDPNGTTTEPNGPPGGPAAVALAAMTALADACFRVDRAWVITFANPAAVALLGRQVDPVVGATARAVFPDAFGATFDHELGRAMRAGVPVTFEAQYLPLQTWLEVRLYPDDAGATVLAHDASARRLAADLLEDQTKVLERIARGRPTKDVLDAVTGLVERHGPGTVCAVHAAGDAGGPLHLASGPSLPDELARAVDVLDVRADGLPPARAAAGTRPVFVPDLLAEPAEARQRDPAVRHGFRGCWAVPVASSEGAVLGVLTVWRRDPGSPAEAELGLLRTGGQLAGIALERRQVEADLRRRELEYRAIFETVQDALIVADLDGYVVEANPAACQLHGGTYDSLVRRHAADLVRPDYHGLLRRLLDDVRQGRTFQGDLVCARRDGSSFPAEVTAVPFAFQGQRHLLAVVRDVSARRQMEEALRGTEERLRTVANGAPLVLFSLDRAGLFTLSEGQALATLGLRPGEVVGQSVFDVYRGHPDVLANLRLVLAGESRRWVSEIGERVFETTARPLRSPRGELAGAVGVALDVTEQATAVEAQRGSEERFRAAFDQAPVGFAHAGFDGRIVRANGRLASILGTPADALTGRRLAEWYAGEGPAADEAAVRRLLSGDAPVYSATRDLRHPDGAVTPAVVSVSLVRGTEGQPRLVILAVTPVGGG
jgi:PAS domain S-box-containing protein